jgi:uncharacterized RDD family membrane protein YckC
MTTPSAPHYQERFHPRPCPSCGRDWGTGLTCQFCSQVDGLPIGVHIASPGRRFGGYLLEGVLIVFTLVIGWFIWALIAFGKGQTPAKQLLGMRCVKLRDSESASWGTMFLREVIAKPVIGILNWLTFGIANFWLLWDKLTQELWDKMVGTIVVNDPEKALDPRNSSDPASRRGWAGSAAADEEPTARTDDTSGTSESEPKDAAEA